MTKYHKIQSVFKRDPKTNYKTFLWNEWSLPEFEYLQFDEWIFEEKVDGTNIRVLCNLDYYGNIQFKGRTDKAQIPSHLLEYLQETFTRENFHNAFPNTESQVVLYGEGYGAKIQKGGGNYSSAPKFALFDVTIDDIFLNRDSVKDIADELNIEKCPEIDYGCLWDAIRLCKDGFFSNWGTFLAEGVVCRPAIELQNRMGSRIITKIKLNDFR